MLEAMVIFLLRLITEKIGLIGLSALCRGWW